MLELVGAVVAGFFGGLIGTISGGGGLVTIPYLLFTGMPIDTAIATSRMSAFGIGAGSFKNFYMSRKIVWKLVPALLAIAVAGAVIGSMIVINLDEHLLENITGFVLLLLLPALFIDKDFGLKEFKAGRLKKSIGLFLYFFAMIYGAFFGPGAGIFLIYILAYFFGLSFLKSSATNLVAWMALTTVAFTIFAFNGLVDFKFGFAMLAGVSLGGYFGSKLAIEKGSGFVKIVLTLVVVATSIRLLLF